MFASFSTTDSKSRLNFLRLLCQPEEQYRLCEEARVCLEFSGAGIKFQAKINGLKDGVWTGREAWQEQLTAWGITSETQCRQVSEDGDITGGAEFVREGVFTSRLRADVIDWEIQCALSIPIDLFAGLRYARVGQGYTGITDTLATSAAPTHRRSSPALIAA